METKMRKAKRIKLYDAGTISPMANTLHPELTISQGMDRDAQNALWGTEIGYVEISEVRAEVLEAKWIRIKLQGEVEDENFEATITYCGSFSIYWAEESEKTKRAAPPKPFG